MAMSIKDIYNQMTTDREDILTDARKASKVTIPDLIPDDDSRNPKSSSHQSTYSSFGQKAVGVLNSKMLLSLLPPNVPFFRKEIDVNTLKKPIIEALQAEVGDEKITQDVIDSVLIENQQEVLKYFERNNIRSSYVEVLNHLIISGNVVLRYSENGLKIFKLNNFVIEREDEDNVILDLITKEYVLLDSLTEEQKEKISESKTIDLDYSNDDRAIEDGDYHELYTRVKKKGKKYLIEQEIENVIVSSMTVHKDKLNYVAPRMFKKTDSSYGRSYVSKFYDDLRDLNNYRKQFISGTATITRTIYLVKPNSLTDVAKINRAKDGDYVVGIPDDIQTLRADNLPQLDSLSSIMAEIKQELKEAFLMLSVRDSERTTSAEVQAYTNELEIQLGGVFSTLAQELQLPTVKAVEAIVQLSDKYTFIEIPHTFDKITTGVEAIGKGQQQSVFNAFINNILAAAQIQPGVVDYVEEAELAKAARDASGIDPKFLKATKKVDELRTQRQQQQQQAAMQEQMLASGGKIAENVISNQSNQNGDKQ